MKKFNLGRIMPINKGEYSASTAYEFMDIVYHDGSSYWCIKNCQGVLPTDTTYWTKVVSRGVDGLDAYMPLKGWFETSTALTTAYPTPAVGDYAYVQGVSSVAIYVCNTAGTWSDSGQVFNPAYEQTFMSGESLDNVRIVDNLESNNSGDVLSAKQGKVLDEKVSALGPKISKIGEEINGVLASDVVENPAGSYDYTANRSSSFNLKSGVVYNITLSTATSLASTLYYQLRTDAGIIQSTSGSIATGSSNKSFSFTPSADYTDVYLGFGCGANATISVLVVSEKSIKADVDDIKDKMPNIEAATNYVNGVSSIDMSSPRLIGEGALIDYYMHSTQGKVYSSANCIVTKPIYLKTGDTVSCSTGGTGLAVFSKSPSENITASTTGFTPISSNASYSGTIAEDGWYVFSGRINRIDGTNLVVSVKMQGDNLQTQMGKKADKTELEPFIKTKATKPDLEISGELGGTIVRIDNGDIITKNFNSRKVNERLTSLEENGVSSTAASVPMTGFSLGANDVKDKIPSLWFDEVATDGTTYATYLDKKIDSVPDGKRFIFITDVHYIGNWKKSSVLIDYARRRLGIKTIIHGGDVENEASTMAAAAKQWLDFNADFVFTLGSDFKQVCGDHDHNGRYANEGQALSYQFIQKVMNGYNINELVYDTLYDERIKTYGWSAEDMSQYDAWKKMHYYYDDATIKTRFIVLHTGWSGEVGLACDKIGTGALSEGNSTLLQMDFLYYALMGIPNGYNVVVCGHNVIGNKSYTVDGSTQYSLTEPVYKGSWRQIAKMIRAFRSKSICASISYRDWSGSSTKTKSYDFTSAPSVGISFCIGGDVHWDILAKSQPSSEDLANVTNGGSISADTDILHVVTMTDGSDRGYRSYPDGELICAPDIANTLDSQAFDIVTMTEDAIYFTRIGSGVDRVVYFN